MRKKFQKAWLVTWEWSADHATVIDRVAAVLNPRLSSSAVADKVEFLYMMATSSLEAQASYAKSRRANPYPATVDVSGHIMCGHHPWLRAQPVTDLHVVSDGDRDIETIYWRTLPIYRLGERGREKVSDGHADSFTRYISGPVSHEIVWDRMKGSFRDGFVPRPA